jgi:hypothetical protein
MKYDELLKKFERKFVYKGEDCDDPPDIWTWTIQGSFPSEVWAHIVEWLDQARAEARKEALQEAIAAVEKITTSHPLEIFSEPWEGWQTDLDRFAKERGKRIDNISAHFARWMFTLMKQDILKLLTALQSHE